MNYKASDDLAQHIVNMAQRALVACLLVTVRGDMTHYPACWCGRYSAALVSSWINRYKLKPGWPVLPSIEETRPMAEGKWDCIDSVLLAYSCFQAPVIIQNNCVHCQSFKLSTDSFEISLLWFFCFLLNLLWWYIFWYFLTSDPTKKIMLGKQNQKLK